MTFSTPWLVAETCAAVCQAASHVSIDDAAVAEAAARLSKEAYAAIGAPAAYDTDMHFVDGGPLTVQYLLCVDALNFCFWPDAELEYEHLARGLKKAVLHDPSCICSQRLSSITGAELQKLLGWSRPLPLQEERARLLREVGQGLAQHFDGHASELVQAAEGSAIQLVQLVTQHFPGFRDHAVYRGRQVFFYKRAQIFVGDVFGAFQGSGLGQFHDINRLTMFADYRVPVVLQGMGILQYSQELQQQIDSKQLIEAGSEKESEIRAASVEAVERLRRALAARFTLNGSTVGPHAIQLDWWLWEIGEAARATDPPHHRTLTVYY